MDPLRVFLFAAMVLHKLVWEVLRRRGTRAARQPFRPIKALKIAVLGGLLLQCFLPELLPVMAEPRVLRVAGAILVALGLATAVAARVQLGRNWSDVESATVLPEQQLVAAGLYRHIRHPIYIGDILLVAGYELALNSWLWLLVVPLTIFVWKKATEEERLLKSGLRGYAEYLETSGRFLPRNAAVGAAAVAIAFTLQFANVQVNFDGNWSALFCTGSMFPPPAVLQQENIHVFAGSPGYDGQFYHYMAHAPWPNEETARHIDAPRLRYPRILTPGLTYIAALGKQDWIDPAFHAISILTFGLGAWWLAGYAHIVGANRYVGLLFFLIPAALISLERVTVDLMLVALCCGFAYYAARGATVACYVVIVLATLTRDTGFLLWGAYGLWLLLNRRWGAAGLFGTAALPASLWYLVVRANTAPASTHIALPESGSALWDRMFLPVYYPLPPWIGVTATVLDYVSLAGIILAIVLATVNLVRRVNDPCNMAGMAFAALPFVLGGVLGWYDAVAYPRTLSPLLLFLGLATLRTRSFVGLLPLLLMLPRLAMVLAPKLPFMRSFLHG
jgi:protein-S-isoprenylcysteine O-methyltransferase Ste14